MLEKILEEIDKAADEHGMINYFDNEPVILKTQAKEIIRKYMNDGWITVEERLPEVPEKTEDEECPEFNVMIKGATIPTTLKCSNDGTWFDDNGYCYSVIAWRPLPEPYKPDDSVKKGFRNHIQGRFMKVR